MSAGNPSKRDLVRQHINQVKQWIAEGKSHPWIADELTKTLGVKIHNAVIWQILNPDYSKPKVRAERRILIKISRKRLDALRKNGVGYITQGNQKYTLVIKEHCCKEMDYFSRRNKAKVKMFKMCPFCGAKTTNGDNE